MRTLLFSILLMLSPALSAAQLPSPEQINTLIKQAGLEQQLHQIPDALRQTAQAPGNPASALMTPLLQSLLTVYDPASMLATLSADLMKRLDVPTLLDAMTWYNSSNARAMLNAQTQATEPATIEKISAALVNQSANVSPQRQQLLQKVLDASQANEAALDMMVNLQAAFMSGLGTMISPSQAQSYQQLRQTFSASKGLMREQLSKQLLLQQSVILEPISDDALNEFLTFANSASGKKLFSALRASLDYTVQTASQNIPAAVRAQTASNATSTQK